MKYRRLGRSGLVVSELGFGCMNFGATTQEKDAVAIVNRAREAGVTLFDTAPAYPKGGTPGLSEEILGKTIKSFRQEVIIVSKVSSEKGKIRPADEPQNSRRHIIATVEKSLRRLQTDYIDLYLAHTLDPMTPIDETLRTFDDLVKSGKVRYIGCANFDAWQLCKALWISDKHNLARFDGIQVRYNLITRAIEREMMVLCSSERVGVIVFNPLAGGLLVGGLYEQGGRLVSPFVKGNVPPETGRFHQWKDYVGRYWHDRNLEAVGKLQNIAKTFGHTPVQTALAWLLSKKTVTSVLTCVDYPDQLDQNLSAAELSLSDKEISELDDIYEAMMPVGLSAQEGTDVRGVGLPGELAF